MDWIINTMKSSIGKKLMMAVTGLGFCGFLFMHLLGNLTLYAGKDAFNAYAEKLHSLGVLINAAEFGLLFFALIHVLTGATLFYENWKARPVRYSVKKNAGGRTIGSMTMPYTGAAMLLFVVIHLSSFTFADKTHQTIAQIVSTAFSDPGYAAFYVIMMAVVGIHVSHGFWSAFQTLGLNHPKYMPIIKLVGIAFSVMVGVGFGFIPVYMSISL